jgi:2-methylisocitrate lyase-like PEP mutase family enzyme
MPCYVGNYVDDDEDDVREHRAKIQKENRVLSAALCAAMTALGNDALNKLDYLEAGVDKQVVANWWQRHQQEDAERRAREMEQRQQQADAERRRQRREEVLAKLTPEERKALNLT